MQTPVYTPLPRIRTIEVDHCPSALQVAAGAIRGSIAVVMCGGDPFIAAQLGAIIGGATGAIVGGLDGLAMSELINAKKPPTEQPLTGILGATLGGVFGAAKGALKFGLTVALAHAFSGTALAGAASGAILSAL